MSPGTPTADSGIRGFFFDLNAARNDTESHPGSPGWNTSPSREWWEKDKKLYEGGSKSEKRKPKPFVPSAFELSLPPDHLPNSPLCPKNPMHRSGGNGICPFHGRKRSQGGLKAVKRVNTDHTTDSGTTGTTGNS